MSAYLCPLCHQRLELQHATLRCNNNHQFDMAKEGYANLLPVQFKKSKQPGDNQDMVQARRRFLQAGHYGFLSHALAHTVAQYVNTGDVCDMGCGEGYYTQAIKTALTHSSVHGADIAKPAIRYGAKRYPDCQFIVASSKQLPFADASMEVVTSIFAPVFADESARLLKHSGHLVVVSPGPSHLHELKALIYERVNAHQAPQTPTGFELINQKQLTQKVSLNAEDATALAKMTPFAWKLQPEHWQHLESNAPIHITLDFYISVFQKMS